MAARARIFLAISTLTVLVGVLAFASGGRAGPADSPAASQPATAPATARPEVYSAWPFSADEAAKRQRATAAALGQPKEMTLDLGNKVAMKLAVIPAGKFIMGSPNAEEGHMKEESPQREVTLTRPFYMGVCLVTQEQYEAVMGKNPSHFKGPQLPVECVSWNDAMDFCEAMSKKTGASVHLPTEAQWEYACRAGNAGRYCFGDNADADLDDYAWHVGNSREKTHPVAEKKPNAFGLYDMHGNVMEWCGDYYENSYTKAGKTDPHGPAEGDGRVLRGGSYTHAARFCRSAFRNESNTHGVSDVGFRVVVVLK